MLLAIARLLLEWDAVDHDFMRRWVNWEEALEARAPEEGKRAPKAPGRQPVGPIDGGRPSDVGGEQLAQLGPEGGVAAHLFGQGPEVVDERRDLRRKAAVA